MKFRAQLIEIVLDYGPASLQKCSVKTIWARGAISRHFFYDVVDLLSGERICQVIQ